MVLSSIIVTSTGDSIDANDDHTTLREAIIDANSNPGADVIEFNIQEFGPNGAPISSFEDIDNDGHGDVFVIRPSSPLPALNDPTGGTTIDGFSQAYYTGDDNPLGPEVVLDGENVGWSTSTWTNAIEITSDNNALLGISIEDFYGIGVHIIGGDNNRVSGTYIGVDPTGREERGLWSVPVRISDGAQNNFVGTDGNGSAVRPYVRDADEGNVLSGSRQSGVVLADGGTTGNVVAGNFIGTDATGSYSLGNGDHGILIKSGAHGNRIGTDGDGTSDIHERNVIAGNSKVGIHISSNDNIVAGNNVGVGADGVSAVGNLLGIVVRDNASNNLVGVTGGVANPVAQRNVVSGNTYNGIRIAGASTQGNVVAGNYVGTDVSGMSAIPNGHNGVRIDTGAHDNLIGTDGDLIGDRYERNIIAGHTRPNIRIFGSGTDNNTIAGNYIGVNANGSAAIGDTITGVWIHAEARSNTIGTNGDGSGDAGEGNVISGHSRWGVRIVEAGTQGNVVAGNFIGTDATGTRAVPNGRVGVNVGFGTEATRVGTDGDGVGDLAERNVVSGNSRYGIQLIGSHRNTVAGNFVGTDAVGNAAVPNGEHGVVIRNGASDNRVGSNGDGLSDGFERNVVSGNGSIGVFLESWGTTHNVVAGNYVGVGADGATTVQNTSYGVMVVGGAAKNIIGTDGTATHPVSQRNVIAGNANTNVVIVGSGADSNIVAGNYIGVDAAGSAALGSTDAGVVIASGASDNIIGTNGDGGGDVHEGNVISGHTRWGVAAFDAGTRGNVIAGNLVGTDASGKRAVPNGLIGVALSRGSEASRVGTDGNGVGDHVERNIISGNSVWGMEVLESHHNVVAGNYVGVDVTGNVALPNAKHGMMVRGGASENRIGSNGDGVSDGIERNIVSGNGGVGVFLWNRGTDGNHIAGNYLGIGADGESRLGNDNGIAIDNGPTDNLIGVSGGVHNPAGQRNIISGNNGSGVSISDANFNAIAGNFVGTDITGMRDVGNRQGVRIDSGATNNRVGSNGDGLYGSVEANLIRFNEDGVVVKDASSLGNAIRGNRIDSNDRLGIDLGDDGVTANDFEDADYGANGLQNYPVLTFVGGGSHTDVSGMLNSLPSTSYAIDFYANTVTDGSGLGEGQRWLGSIIVTTDTGGDASFSATLQSATAHHEQVAATATQLADHDADVSTPLIARGTSEFSASRPVNRPPTADPGGSYVVDEGASLQLDASGSTDPDQLSASLSYEWDLDYDGQTFDVDLTGFQPVASFADDLDARTIAVRVTDEGGLTDFASTTVTVVNVAPSLIALSSDHDAFCDSSENGEVMISGAYVDEGELDTHSVMIDWGDDGPKQTIDSATDSFNATHTYAHGGVFTITVTVVDDDRGVSTSEQTMAVVQGVGIVDGTLYIIGSDNRDHVNVKAKAEGKNKPAELTVDAKFNQGSGGDQVRIKQAFKPDEIDQIAVFLCEGDDHYNGGSVGGGKATDLALDQIVFGGAGKDHIKGGRTNDVLVGGAGKDKIFGRRGDDLLIGGSVGPDNDAARWNDLFINWSSDDVESILLDLGPLSDDLVKDDLKGGQGGNRLVGGIGDKLR